jgi:ubiquitin carboxyl-terminal hydrolase 14
VKFPQELDALDLAAPELHEKLAPVSSKLKAIEKERAERRKIRKRTKNVPTAGLSKEKEKGTDVEMADTTTAAANPEVVASGSAEATEDKGKGKELPAGELEDESVYREKETEELASLVHPSLREDIGCNPTGLYELVGSS